MTISKNHYERLGLPRRFSVDLAELERLYLAKSREVHPDFHSLASADAQAKSLVDTAAVNEAYITLKDSFRRADYLMQLLGGPTATQHKDMTQMFLMEMMDLREELEQAKTSHSEEAIEKMERDLSSRFDDAMQSVAKQFEKIEAGAEAEAILLQIRKELNAAKVIRGLLRDVHN